MLRKSNTGLDISPPINRCNEFVSSIDRTAFRKSIHVLAARVPASKTGTILRAEVMRRMILDLPKIRSVVSDVGSPTSDSMRLVLLRVNKRDVLAAEVTQYLEEGGAVLVDHTIDLDYDYWTADEILQAVLPEDLCDSSPTGFAITGHLAHFNLRDEYLPYKHVIGQVVVDKNKRIRTVVNKLDNIHNQFRYFDMELIAGEPDYIVEHHESDCRFTFDFTKVYWNSRLHTEHERLVRLFEATDGIIADVFAGVGPFAIPAAKKGCAVFANDLNPNSAEWLRRNVCDNQVTENVRVTCEDGRQFIRAVVRRALADPFLPFTGIDRSKRRETEERRRRQLMQPDTQQIGKTMLTERHVTSSGPLPPPRNWISHFVMNLPDTALEFLDAFRGILSGTTLGRDLDGVYDSMPMVHCHCFTRFLDRVEAEADIRKRAEKALGHPVEDDVSLHMVRSVAPNKDMYCLSFRLPRRVAFC